MNWTEGALARHSRRRGWNEDAARQKQYFAKARAHRCQRSVLTNTSEGTNGSFVPDHIPQTPKSALANSNITSISQTSAQKSRRRTQRLSTRKMAPETFVSPFFEMGRKRERDSPINKGLSPNSLSPDIESKRQKLLEKRDWTGIEVQKPLIVDFSHPRPENLFSHQRKGAYRGHASAYKVDDPMKIRIGAHNLEWSNNNNSLVTPSLTSEFLPSLQDWESFGPCTPVHVPSSPSHDSFGVSTSPSVQANILQPYCHLQGAGYNAGFLHGQGMNYNSLNGCCGAEEPKYKVQSTPAEFHHPQPSRGERPRLFDLRSPEPQQSGSMIVELGGPVPYQNSDEEEEWRNWLHSMDEFSFDHNFILDGEYEMSSTLTPGISEAACPVLWSSRDSTQVQPESPVTLVEELEESENKKTSMTQIEWEQDSQHSNPGAGTEKLCTVNPTEVHATSQDLMLPSVCDLLAAPAFQAFDDFVGVEEAPQMSYVDLLEEATGNLTEADDEEIWKKFIFDNDSDLTESTVGEVQTDTATERMDNQSSCHSAYVQSTPNGDTDITSFGKNVSDNPGGFEWSLNETSSPNLLENCLIEDKPQLYEQGPLSGNPEQDDFKFHHPRPFIGRLASQTKATPKPRDSPLKRTRGRPKKKRDAQRPDIRAMPNFDGDPIDDPIDDE
ncbi:unnamed protein product [Clonostachys chloroleuca]|uniref:Uncharacterized protein n=1 Tax=Clonostachys chloroleuca TaxID=1926264 RepID=A0AA35MJ75_9HYPO|nr:unnamed protein product [Clonostachys chloroleuca]